MSLIELSNLTEVWLEFRYQSVYFQNSYSCSSIIVEFKRKIHMFMLAAQHGTNTWFSLSLSFLTFKMGIPMFTAHIHFSAVSVIQMIMCEKALVTPKSQCNALFLFLMTATYSITQHWLMVNIWGSKGELIITHIRFLCTDTTFPRFFFHPLEKFLTYIWIKFIFIWNYVLWKNGDMKIM